MFKTVYNFINYWFFRYLLVTELYMVEKWERVMIHIVFFIMLLGISLFNSGVILRSVSYLTGFNEANEHNMEILSHSEL